MNGWFPKLRKDGVIASGSSEVWLTPLDRPSFLYSPVGGGPIWAHNTLIYNHRDGKTTQVGNSTVPEAYNDYRGSDTDSWAGFIAVGNGETVIYSDTVIVKRMLNVCAPRFGGTRFGYLDPYQPAADHLRSLILDDVLVARDIILDWIMDPDGKFCIYQTATSTYGRQIKDSTGKVVSINDSEAPIALAIAPDGEPWLISASNQGVFVRPVYSYMGYRLTGELYYPDARIFDNQIHVVSSFGNGAPRFVDWINLTAPREDLRKPIDVPIEPPIPPIEPPVEPPIEPPVIPPVKPPIKPPKPEKPYYEVKEYPVMTTEIVAIKGPGNKFGRVVAEDASKGPFGWYPIRFDRDTPDDDCWFELSKPDSRHKLKHTKIDGLFGADATENSDSIPHQFYLKPGNDRGILESPVIIYSPTSVLIVGFFEWDDKIVAGPAFAVVKQ